MLSLLVLIPLLGIIILNLPLRFIKTKAAFWLALAVSCTQILMAVFHHRLFTGHNVWALDSIFNLHFHLDHFSFVMILSIGIVSFSSLLVASATIKKDNDKFNFINLLTIASIGMSGMVVATDVFSLYLFLEITAVASFILLAFGKGSFALEGAFKYILFSTIATVLMVSSIALLLLTCGGTSFDAIKHGIKLTNPSFAALTMGLFILGLLIKGGVVPFHWWVPDAYSSAPAPVSILLAGIITKASGIYALIRMSATVFGLNGHSAKLILFLGTVSVLFGAFGALGQVRLKRLLAYSSISQVGYILLGLGCATPLGIFGAIFHLFNHAIFKSLLFTNAAAVEHCSGTRDMDKMGGLSDKMPVTGITSIVGALSASGIPPFAGFWSKLIIVLALWRSGNYVYTVIAIMAGVITLAYLLYMQHKVFFGKLASGMESVKEANMSFKIVSIVLACVTLGVGLVFPLFFEKLIEPIKEILVR